MNKIALGTAQFGSKYGIANQNGKINSLDAKKILRLANISDIDLIDTAISYGDSEKLLEKRVLNFKVVSKLPPLPNKYLNLDAWVNENVNLSLKRLGIDSLYGLLIHKSDNFLEVRVKN